MLTYIWNAHCIGFFRFLGNNTSFKCFCFSNYKRISNRLTLQSFLFANKILKMWNYKDFRYKSKFFGRRWVEKISIFFGPFTKPATVSLNFIIDFANRNDLSFDYKFFKFIPQRREPHGIVIAKQSNQGVTVKNINHAPPPFAYSNSSIPGTFFTFTPR